MFNAVREHLGHVLRPDDASVTVVVVGDGLTPRTAALFCFRTRWSCVSIDPLMTEDTPWSERIERLTALRGRLQDAAPEGGFAAERLLLILPHAHIGLDECVRYVRWRRVLAAVVMPCCNFYAAADGCGAPLHSAPDPGIISPHRDVNVWCWQRGEVLPPPVPPAEVTEAEEEAPPVLAPAMSMCAVCT